MARKLITLDMDKWVEGVELDLMHFDYLWPIAYPMLSKIKIISKVVRRIAKDSVIATDQLLEKGISVVGKLKRDATQGKDYVDLSDSKLVSARIASKGSMYSAKISNIHCKRGWLRAVIHERTTNKYYFFLIPFEAYKNIIYKKKSGIITDELNSNAAIEIPFTDNGVPKLDNKWWKLYQVASFEIMCGPVINP